MLGRKLGCFAMAMLVAGMAFASQVEVTGGCLNEVAPISPGTQSEDMYWLSFRTFGGTATVDKIKVENRVYGTHTTADGDVDTMELWADTDGNGDFTTAGDTRIAFSEVTGDGSGGYATLDPASNISVGETWSMEYYIVFDISSTAPGWHYVGVYMADSTYVTLVGSDTVTNLHFPHGVYCDQSLPVVLTSFNAYPGDGMVTLKWRTETELNSIRWIIERSASERGEYKRIGYAGAQGSVTYPTNYEFTDREVKNGVTYWYKLTVECVDGNTTYEPVSATPSDKIPMGPSAILKICPNPFKGTTKIEYSITENCHVSLNVYDFTGRVIRTLVDANKSVGKYSANWDGRDSDGREVTAGAYLCLISSNGYSCTKKIMLLK